MRPAHPTPAAISSATTRLGELLVARTALGVAAVWLGDDVDALLIALQTARPDLDLRARPTLAQRRETDDLARHADRAGPLPDAPLHLHGTPWQRRVWGALRSIPVGGTLSYGAFAAALDAPLGSRAVARACAANDLALLIPCHRVIRADGELGGYRWGVARKAALLASEAAAVSSRSSTPPATVPP
jgi:O-6-methylguanine DNA methyltransferase